MSDVGAKIATGQTDKISAASIGGAALGGAVAGGLIGSGVGAGYASAAVFSGASNAAGNLISQTIEKGVGNVDAAQVVVSAVAGAVGGAVGEKALQSIVGSTAKIVSQASDPASAKLFSTVAQTAGSVWAENSVTAVSEIAGGVVVNAIENAAGALNKVVNDGEEIARERVQKSR